MEKLELKRSDREELERRGRSRKVRAEDARRARLILLLAEGEPYTSIQSKLRCNRSYVSRWKGRFLEGGIAGLYARQQGRKRSVLTPAMEARILKWTSASRPMERRTGRPESWERSSGSVTRWWRRCGSGRT